MAKGAAGFRPSLATDNRVIIGICVFPSPAPQAAVVQKSFRVGHQAAGMIARDRDVMKGQDQRVGWKPGGWREVGVGRQHS